MAEVCHYSHLFETGIVYSPNISGTYNGRILTYISCMDTAYVRKHPPPKEPYKVQYLHFRYLKLLVMYLFIDLVSQRPSKGLVSPELLMINALLGWYP